MENENWYHVDNVGKVFLATHNKRDTRSQRLCCSLNEDVEPEILQEALDKTIRSRKQFQVRIRRGLFWHYVEPTNAAPRVVAESGRPCPVLYGKNYSGVLHYQVSYFRNRINLDIFHALTDGNGALEFLNIIVYNYLSIKHPDKMAEAVAHKGTDAASLEQDSFRKFYEETNRFKTGADAPHKAYHIHSRKLPYDQVQFLEVHMKASEVLPEAKKLGVSLTSYFGARLMMALFKDMPGTMRKLPVTISMPVNLRNFYPSETGRNFFNSVTVSHIHTGDDTLESLSAEYNAKLKECLTKERMMMQMQNFEKIETIFIARIAPLAIKQLVVRYFAKKEAKAVSAVLSNMGAVTIPEEMREYIKGYTGFCSTSELFVVVSSYGDDMVLGISYAYAGTGVLKNFLGDLQKDGMSVRVSATEVVK